MIRLTYLMRHKPGESREQFQNYWANVHGPLLAGHAHPLNVMRCVQVHTIEQALSQDPGPRGIMEEPYDGVEEIWWNSHDDLTTALNTARGEAAYSELLEDEKKFIDLPHSPLWLNYEYPQVNPTPENIVATQMSSIVKLYFIFRHPISLSLERAQLYWRTQHGPLIRRIAESGHIKRYVQVHRFDDPLEAEWRKVRGTLTETYTGHAELWYDLPVLLGPQTPEREKGGQLAVEDERKFIDFARSSIWFAREKVFVDNR